MENKDSTNVPVEKKEVCVKILCDYTKCLITRDKECNVFYENYKECMKKEKSITWPWSNSR